jgi:UTP--glucose-1-phosphate uridylyltransferase
MFGPLDSPTTMDELLDPKTTSLLSAYGFDREQFERLRTAMLQGELGTAQNRIQGIVEPPAASEVPALPAHDSAARRELHERGMEALRNGEVGCVVLAGGMATRFGGVVKAAVEALPGRSFLSLKLADIRRMAKRAGKPVPIYLMSSFATHDALQELAREEQSHEAPIEVFPQFISLRLTPEGALFREADGALSPYAPGHGDLSFALRASGALQRFVQRGGRLLATSNVDNLGATLDPAILGQHLRSGVDMTIEIGRRTPGEAGGMPLRVSGKLQIVEDFRVPSDFDVARVPLFNTNTFVLAARAIDRDFPLSWFLVRKKVDGREAIQFERLVGQLSAFLPCACIEVPRSGDDGRFQPVKDPEELERRRPDIERILRVRGVI